MKFKPNVSSKESRHRKYEYPPRTGANYEGTSDSYKSGQSTPYWWCDCEIGENHDSSPSTPKIEGWEEDFDKLYVKGFKLTKTQKENIKVIKSFISQVLKQQKETIREKFVQTAIEGKNDSDNLKGAMLYSRFLQYLDSLEEELGK